jgi:DNA repair protein SbcC/Rad50
MIPRRIYLKGFMCYREETEICFTGSSIWALCGANGAGKSAIFDAMLFTLYGEHRMSRGERLTGKQNVEELIHREAKSFTIEFDFALGENVYRVRRTFSRKKRGTMLALHLSGPDAPFPGRSGPQQYPGTETKDGFDSWVLQTVRLNANTFRVAVLLMQGQSDVLLKLGGAEKHDVLTQVIDLSRYEALCKLASSKQKDREISAKDFATLLTDLEEVDDAHVLDLENKVNKAKAGKEEARLRQLHLTGLREQAKRWQKLQEIEQQLTGNLAKYRSLLDQTAQIEQRATRLDTLQKVIAPLTQIYGWQSECAKFDIQMKQGREKAQTLEGSLQEQDEKLRVTQRQLAELRVQRAETDREQKELQPRLLKLQTVCSDIARLQGLQQRYRDLNQQVSAYAPDLEQQQRYLQTRLTELKHIEDALPRLEQFDKARRNWQKATRDLAEVKQELSKQEELLAEIEKQANLLLEQSTALNNQLSSLQSDVASKKALQGAREERLARFQSIDGQPTCSYCGMPLTCEHLDDERRRVEAELREAKLAYQKALTQYTTIAQQKKDLEQKLDQLSRQDKSQQQIIKQCEKRCDRARSDQTSASAQASIVLQMLTHDYIARIQGSANAPLDLEACLQAIYPTPHDLDELAAQLRDKASLERRMQAVTQDVDRLAGLKRERDYVYSEIQPLEQAYPPERVTVLIQEQEHARQRNTELLDSLDKLDNTIVQQSQQLERLGREKQQTVQEKGLLERTIAVAETNLGNAERSIKEVQKTLPAEWRAQLECLSDVLLNGWKQEMEALAGSAQQLRELQNAQQNFTRYQQELLDLKVEKDLIPEEARQAPEQLEKASEQSNVSYGTLEEQERTLNVEIMRLQNIRDRRIALEQQRAGAARLASRYKDLANLLGRDGLQHYLLQKAEAGIVYHANEILDGISGGTLRLELQSSTDRKAEALDMVAYNTAISTSQSQPIRLLSGSQQFRVSVSLALGIGKYAGNENHRLEAVVIDEGFGSLDENGRREMIQAIKELGDGGVLKCIIVVSHQREFFDEFPNRYLVELVDGSTQISLA